MASRRDEEAEVSNPKTKESRRARSRGCRWGIDVSPKASTDGYCTSHGGWKTNDHIRNARTDIKHVETEPKAWKGQSDRDEAESARGQIPQWIPPVRAKQKNEGHAKRGVTEHGRPGVECGQDDDSQADGGQVPRYPLHQPIAWRPCSYQ